MSVVQVLLTQGGSIAVFLKVMTIVLFSSMLLVVSTVSMAGTKVIPVEEMNYNYTINASMMDNLNALTGKRVTLFLDGGKVLTGIVKSVGAHLAHLEKIERNDFFDLLIRIESIQAIEVKSREYQR